MLSSGTVSELSIPLMVRDSVVGVLDCQSDNPDHFDKETIDLLTLFSTQASMALQNARLYSLEQRRATQLQAINSIAKHATSVLELDKLVHSVCMLVQRVSQAITPACFCGRKGRWFCGPSTARSPRYSRRGDISLRSRMVEPGLGWWRH